ncbi:MAG: cadherin-like beta sandwich domain-containing protein [Hydrogenoanaerobacterium sp.]
MKHIKFKKITCAFMAAVLVMLSAPFTLPAQAAVVSTNIPITFANGKHEAEVIEGNDTAVDIKLPNGYIMAEPPFVVYERAGQPLTPTQNFIKYTKPGSGQLNGTFTANAGSAGGTPAKPDATAIYKIKGVAYATIAEGEATETWQETTQTNPNYKPGDTGDKDFTEPAGKAIADVRSVIDSAITIDSQITIRCTADETNSSSLSFEVVGSGAGTFLPYDDVTVEKKSGGVKALKVTLSQKVSKPGEIVRSLVLELEPKQSHSIVKEWVDSPKGSGKNWKPVMEADQSYKIAAGTIYVIKFLMPTSPDLLLNVVTPQHFTNQTADNIGGTSTSKNYIKLAQGDEQDWITKDFTLVTREIGYNNASAKIKWEWKPNDPKYKDIIDDIGDGQNAHIGKPPIDDVKGKLEATVTYDSGKAGVVPGKSVVSVPVTIKGIGKPAFVQLKQKWTGSVEAPITIPPADANDINNMPTRMDVYDAHIAGFTAVSGPYQMTAAVHMGEKNAACEYLKITTDDPSALSIYVGGDNSEYVFGSEIKNQDQRGEGIAELRIRAKTGNTNTKLTFTFYRKNNAGVIAPDVPIISRNITVEDSTPDSDATLKSFTLKSSDLPSDYPPLSFGFTPEKTEYQSPVYEVPYAAKTIDVSSAVNKSVATSTIRITTAGLPPQSGGKDAVIKNVPLEVGKVTKIEVVVLAEDRNEQTYRLSVTRAAANRDSSLSGLGVFTEEGAAAEDLLKDKFKKGTQDYSLLVPYGVKRVRVEPTTTNRFATVTLDPVPQKGMFFGTTGWIPLTHPAPTKVTVMVTAEDTAMKTPYTISITRDDPSENNKLESLDIFDKKDAKLDFKGKAVFKPETRDYYMDIPYSMETIRIKAKPQHDFATTVTIVYDAADLKHESKAYDQKNKTPVDFRTVAVPVASYPGVFTFRVYATAESEKPASAAAAGADKYYLYSIEFSRQPANTDKRLKTLLLTDQDNKGVDTFTFNTEQLTYDIKVPYVTSSVNVEPTTMVDLSRVEVNNMLISDNRKYVNVPLTAGKTEVVKVKVVAENGENREYILNVTRQNPSTECRLETLSIPESKDFLPRFAPSTTAYTAKLPQGVKTYTVLAKPVDTYATMEINGKSAKPNTPFGPINSIELKSSVTIIVTAEDGKTKKTYNIKISDENYIVKSKNADLDSLVLENGELSPRFKPGIVDYEAYVKDDADWIGITPRTADKNATVKVFNGSRQLKRYYDGYSTAITDDTMELRIEVTPSSGDKPKIYTVVIYRKNDEKKGKLKPITAEMVNYEQASPIIIDITKYHIVAADVINTMKGYPDKSIIFKGNDYSFEMRGKDLKELVPNTATFDMAVSFETPNEDAIRNIVSEQSRNDALELVFVYFKHHGELPAPFKLTLSLGREYQNKTLYWNYYNDERERIDYYGNIRTNVKGTFSTILTHMSDYVVTRKRIIGSENKESEPTSYSASVAEWVGEPKTNPNTGSKGWRRE